MNPILPFRYVLLLTVAVFTTTTCGAAPAESSAEIAFFETKIRPVLVEHCYECHSAQTGAAEGSLELDTRQSTRQGGDRGPAVVAGDLQSSWLWLAMSHEDNDLRMPPKRERLPDTVLADFKKWIERGAVDPRTEAPMAKEPAWIKAGQDFWAYQRPTESAPPHVTSDAWPKKPLDYFVLAKLEEKGLAPSGDAQPQTLLRRLRFDLVGLPPSDVDLKRFQQRIDDEGLDAAIALEVDEMLASSEFGERWGRHWLDVARFAESSGTEANISFPYAWRYRDYVINCFNDDVPFDRFLIEQIAGDLLPYEDEADRARLLIATGFLALGPKNLDSVDQRQFQADVIDEQIDTVTRAIVAGSVACARCHDHKFDPYSMTDYYALAGIFASSKTFFGTSVSPANRIGGDPLLLPKVDGQHVLHASLPKSRVETLKTQLAQLRAEKTEMDEATMMMFSGKKPAKEVTLRDALRVFWQTGSVEGELEKVSDTGEALPLAMGVLDSDEIVSAPLLQRGDINKPSTPIPRAVPQVIRIHDAIEMPGEQSGRLQLTQWLADPEHPLTPRVIVNRVWHHMFGTGIVATVDNFGSTGERPTHPELLDTLAAQFVQDGWSIKRLVREIALSHTYRQSSAYRVDAFHLDPDNRLLWRASKRRLEAECIRDAMLAVSGELDLDRPVGSLVGKVIGDRPISLIGLDKRLPADLDGSVHRSVYLPVIRDRLPDVLDLFDFAEPKLVTGDRETTNVPIQALYLLNSPFVLDRAASFAARLNRECDTNEQQIRQAFLLCYNREPDQAEMERSIQFLSVENAETDTVSTRLVSFCQALMCTAEFRNLD